MERTAQEMIAEGRMPSFEQLVEGIESAAAQIEAKRKKEKLCDSE
jgi:hypothetical protein